jgi:hypothetical protein
MEQSKVSPALSDLPVEASNIIQNSGFEKIRTRILRPHGQRATAKSPYSISSSQARVVDRPQGDGKPDT